MFGKYIDKRVAWPWVKSEIRSGYETLLIAGLEATAEGTARNVVATGAAEIAASMWARVLAAATITGTEALTARVLHHMGRHLIRDGEAVYVLDTSDGVTLEAVSQFEVLSGWRYQVEIPRPPAHIVKRTLPRDAVLHVQWAADPSSPWKSIPPLASGLGKLAAASENKLIEELNTPTAHLIPTPADGGEAALTQLRADIQAAKGGAVLAEATSTGWDDDRNQAGTRNDWRAERLGPEILLEQRMLHKDVADYVFSACGIPPSLVGGDSDGTQAREDYRRFVMASVEPVAKLIAEAASEALEASVSFDFSGIWAHDLAGRASAFQKLVAGGMAVEKAVQVTGLMIGE